MHAAEHQRPEIAAARQQWQAVQPFLDVDCLVFLDETGTATNMARRYGRSPRGQRLIGHVPQVHWKTTTLVAGLRRHGIVAPMVLDGPMTGAAFRAYVEQLLAPSLRAGDIVIMDNLSCHKVCGVQQAIHERGAQIFYLPPYSPDLNPIEQSFAKLKARLRKAAERNVEALWHRIGTVLDEFHPTECANYLSNAGYA